MHRSLFVQACKEPQNPGVWSPNRPQAMVLVAYQAINLDNSLSSGY